MLLWEIHRLRSIVLHANDFVRQAKYHGLYRHMDTTSQTLFKRLQETLKHDRWCRRTKRGVWIRSADHLPQAIFHSVSEMLLGDIGLHMSGSL